MNNYKSFSELKEELGNNYDFKLYEMGISALKEIENLQQENKQLKETYKEVFNNYQKLKKDNETLTLLNIHQSDKIQQLKDNWNKLKEYINKMHEYFLYTDVNEIYKQNMKADNQFPNLFNLSELNASDRILSSICKKIQELEQGSDSNE